MSKDVTIVVRGGSVVGWKVPEGVRLEIIDMDMIYVHEQLSYEHVEGETEHNMELLTPFLGR